MAEETATTSTDTTTEAPVAATGSAPEATKTESSGGPAPESSSGFNMSEWTASGGNRSDLPENMRQFYDHITDQQKKADAFNAVRELQNMIDDADRRSAANSQRNTVHDSQDNQSSDIEQQVQARLAQMQNQESVTKFRNNFESMLKEPIKVGDGHTFAFSDKGELEKFVNYSRDVLQNGKISPQDLYKLWNFERILADTGEWKARQHEEKLRKTASGPSKSEDTAQKATETDSKSKAGESDSNLTVEEIMKLKFPEIYGNMKAGNVRYG